MAERRNVYSSSTHTHSQPFPPSTFKPKQRLRTERSSSSSSEKACVVCYRDVQYHSVGMCEHSVCFECSSRMRVLLEQNECPICRKSLDQVIFTNGIKSYAEVNDKIRMYILLPKYGIYVEDEVIKTAFDKLLEHKCFLCPEQPSFDIFQSLREHTQRKHELYACDLCAEHIKHFTKERKFYTRADLGYHKRKGDRNDTSHRGHPLCKFCDKRFFDSDELFKHLRKDHYFCHFCDADGYNHYYNTYDDLRLHYRKEHFLCEEEHCAEEKFTSVFRSEIDLKAHLASAHSRLLGKHGTKQARTLELEFALPKRPENERGRFGRPIGGRGRGDRRGGRDRERENDLTTEEENSVRDTQIVQVPTIQPKIDSAKDFPTLDGGSSVASGGGGTGATISVNGASIAQKLALSSGMNVPIWNAKTKREDEFPALDGSLSSTQPSFRGVPPASQTLRSVIPGFGIGKETRKPNSGSRHEDDFPSLQSMGTTGSSNKVWSGSGASVKMKLLRDQEQQQLKGQPKGKKVAPFPLTDEKSKISDHDFHFVPLSVSTRSAKSNGIKSDVFPLQPETQEVEPVEPEVKKENPKGKKKKSHAENSVAQAAAALFNGGTAPHKFFNKSKNPISQDIVEDFPSLPISVGKKALPSERKQPRSWVPPPPRKISPPPGFHQLKRDEGEEDLSLPPNESPPLPLQNATPPRKPPPGFEKQPPGLPLQTGPRSNFLDSVLEFDEVSVPKNGEYPLYVQPMDIKIRNERLMEAIRGSLNMDSTAFDSFLNVSSLFRRNELPAQEYYDTCQDMFGTLDFRVIFSELIVLLPDIQKQQELLVAHRKSGGKGERLSTCHICSQVIKTHEVSFHMKSHSGVDSFPALSSTSFSTTGKIK